MLVNDPYDKNKTYDVFLEDNGTIDTTISINNKFFTFSHEHILDMEYRDKNGHLTENALRELAESILKDTEVK